jgi:hypothetical protein
MTWLPIDVNLWEHDGWFIAKAVERYWLSLPNAAECGPFLLLEDAKQAVEEMTKEKR